LVDTKGKVGKERRGGPRDSIRVEFYSKNTEKVKTKNNKMKRTLAHEEQK